MTDFADISVYLRDDGSMSEVWINGQPTLVDHLEIEQGYETIRDYNGRFCCQIRLNPVIHLSLPVKTIKYIKEENHNYQERKH